MHKCQKNLIQNGEENRKRSFKGSEAQLLLKRQTNEYIEATSEDQNGAQVNKVSHYKRSRQRQSSDQLEVMVDSRASEHAMINSTLFQARKHIKNGPIELANVANVTASRNGLVEVRAGGRPIVLSKAYYIQMLKKHYFCSRLEENDITTSMLKN